MKLQEQAKCPQATSCFCNQLGQWEDPSDAVTHWDYFHMRQKVEQSRGIDDIIEKCGDKLLSHKWRRDAMDPLPGAVASGNLQKAMVLADGLLACDCLG